MYIHTSNYLGLIQPLENAAPTRYGGEIIFHLNSQNFGALGLRTAPGVVGPHHIFENRENRVMTT